MSRMISTSAAFDYMNRARKGPAIFLTLTTLALASCGGGGGGSAYSTAPPAPAPAAPTPSPPASAGYTFKSLVADHAGTSATTTDPNLVNPWGIVIGGT